MTVQELKIIYSNNIIRLQDLTIRKLTKANSFLGLPNFKQRELNRESVACLRQALRVLRRNLRKDIKQCENEPIDSLMSADKVEELVNEKVEQSDF